MEEETTVCTNCQRPIASSNHVMHSLHCHRNLEKCPVCGDAVPRSEMSAHAEHHAEESCSDCGVKVPRDHHEEHKASECKLRKISCAFCTLEVPGTELQEHEDYCGSRTERCADCGKFVMLKYQQLHLDSNHTFLKIDDEPVPPRPPKFGDFLVRKTHKESPFYSGLPSNDMSSLDRLLALHLRDNDAMMAGPDQSSASSSSNSYSYPIGEDSVALPCEFCQAVVPSDKLMEHQTGCNPEVTPFMSRDTASKINKTSVNSALKNGYRASGKSSASTSMPVYTIDDSDDEVTILNSDEREFELPCEFCDQSYPASLLTQHQEICELRLATSMSPAAHHWSLPTPGARTITPPLTRKRLNAETKTVVEGLSSDVATKPVSPIAIPITGRIEDRRTSNSDIANSSTGAVPKQTRSRKKRRAPAPPTPT